MEQNGKKGLEITFLKEKLNSADLYTYLEVILGCKEILLQVSKFSMASQPHKDYALRLHLIPSERKLLNRTESNFLWTYTYTY